MTADEVRPPSVDALARSLAIPGLPHPLAVDAARAAIGAGAPGSAQRRAEASRDLLLRPVVNATGVLLHTNLGRAPFALDAPTGATNLELALSDGRRGSRQAAVDLLFARLCGAEAAMAVNNGAAAVTLAVAATAAGRDVVVSRGESVEIGGGFRIPDVVASSGSRLLDVGTTNRSWAADYARAVADPRTDVGCLLKVHRSNFHVGGFVAEPAIEELADCGAPLVVDLGSGLVDARCPWLPGGPPSWLRSEPGARQALAAGAALVTFSGDKLLGGPQAGIVAGSRALVDACGRHPLARAVRPGLHVLAGLQDVALRYLDGTAGTLPFWARATAPVRELERRATALVDAVGPTGAGLSTATSTAVAGAGAGSGPGTEIPSVAVVVVGNHAETLRGFDTPVIARVHDGRTWCDLRTIAPEEDSLVAEALRRVVAPR